MQRPFRSHPCLFGLLLSLSVGFAGGAGHALGQSDGSEKIYQKTLKSTVWVVVPVGKEGNKVKIKSGTGSLIYANRRLILTNYHVVEGTDKEVFVHFPIYEKGKPVAEKKVYFD